MAGLMFPVVGAHPSMSPVPAQQQAPDLASLLQASASPVAAPAPVNTPQAPEQDWLSNLSNDPARTLALLQFAGQALKPVGAGSSQASVLGDALSSAVGTFSQQRKNEQGNQINKDAIAESKRKDEELNPLETAQKNLYNSQALKTAREAATAKGEPFDEKAYAMSPSFIKKYAAENNISLQSAEVEILRGLVTGKTTQDYSQEATANMTENATFNINDVPAATQNIQNLGPKKLISPEAQAWLGTKTAEQLQQAYKTNPQAYIEQFGDYGMKLLNPTGK